jgi:hypothetical protein
LGAIAISHAAMRSGNDIEDTTMMAQTSAPRSPLGNATSALRRQLFVLFTVVFLLLGSTSSVEDETTCEADLQVDEADDHNDADADFDLDEEDIVSDDVNLVHVAWGESQQIVGGQSGLTRQVLKKTHKYMTEQVMVDETFASVRDKCKLRNELCSFWAAIGECEANKGFMLLSCAPACQSCDQIDFNHRCPFDKEPTVWNKGDVNKIFERITTDEYFQKFAPSILSRDPWVVVLDDFLQPSECQRLIDLGAEAGYQRSEDLGDEVMFDGSVAGVQSEQRTSTNAWCTKACYEDPVSMEILQRMENLTLIPERHYEFLQLLRYEPTQFYGSHHE